MNHPWGGARANYGSIQASDVSAIKGGGTMATTRTPEWQPLRTWPAVAHPYQDRIDAVKAIASKGA